MPTITSRQLLSEFEDLLRAMPSWDNFYYKKDEIFPWMGRALALVDNFGDTTTTVFFQSNIDSLSSSRSLDFDGSLRKIKTTIHKIISQLQLQTVGPTTIVADEGNVYKYFDALSKEIEKAKIELLFVDPYLDHEFVQRYLPYVTHGVLVKLLTSKKLNTLMPAVEMFVNEHKISIEVRSFDGLHDRYLFVDRMSCYQSGASFKDAAKTAATTLTQITDAFDAMLSTYEKKWAAAARIEYKVAA